MQRRLDEKNYARTYDVQDLPSLIEIQLDSFRRFREDGWSELEGIPYLADACASIFCEVRTTLIHGTHELFIGNAYEVRCDDGSMLKALGWVEGGFANFRALV